MSELFNSLIFKIAKEEKIVEEPTGQLIVRKISIDDINWDEVYYLILKVEKLIDASSGLLKYIGDLVNKEVKVNPAIVSSIKFSSPGELSVNIDWRVIALLVVIIRIMQHWSFQKERFKEETRGLKIDNDMREIQVEMARKVIKSRKLRKLDIVKNLIESLPSWVKKVFNISNLPSNLFEAGSLEEGIAAEQILPAATDLIAGDDPEIEMEVKEENSEENSG